MTLTETEETAVCLRCDIRFSTREPTRAIQKPAKHWFTRGPRWRLAISSVLALGVTGCRGGVVGAAIAVFAVTMVTMIAIVVRARRRD